MKVDLFNLVIASKGVLSIIEVGSPVDVISAKTCKNRHASLV